MKNKKAITMVELLIAIFILVTGFSALLIVYSTSATATQRARNRMFAAKEMSTIYEAINRMPLSMIKNQRGNNTYWQALGEGLLPTEVVTVSGVNDTYWTNDPLHLEIELSWYEFGTNTSISFDALFTEHL